MINDGDQKATHPKEKKKVGIGKKTKRKSIRKYSKLMHEKDDDNVFEVRKLGKIVKSYFFLC